jgi:glycosyltransferase involved in cell wall biosynthesis
MLCSILTVSVCIPTYYGATHLGAAIDSVLSRDFTDFELIIIDDNAPRSDF